MYIKEIRELAIPLPGHARSAGSKIILFAQADRHPTDRLCRFLLIIRFTARCVICFDVLYHFLHTLKILFGCKTALKQLSVLL